MISLCLCEEGFISFEGKYDEQLSFIQDRNFVVAIRVILGMIFVLRENVEQFV